MALVALLTVGCDWLLEVNPADNNISRLTQDVEFTATSAACQHFTGVYADYPNRENFHIELLGDPQGDARDAMILDLLTPEGQTTPVGVFTVGTEGECIALSRYDVVDENTGIIYNGGCFYGRAIGGYIKDYFGFLTEGEVRITCSEEGVYDIEVTAKSGTYSVSVVYNGVFTANE